MSEKKIEDIKSIGIGLRRSLYSKSRIIITMPNLIFRNFKLVQPIRDKCSAYALSKYYIHP